MVVIKNTKPIDGMSLMAIIAFMATCSTFFYFQFGLLLFMPFVLIAALAFVPWLIWSSSQAPPDKLIVLYSLAIIGLVVLNDLRILGGYTTIGSLVFNGVFLCGGYLFITRQVIGYYVLSFLYFWCMFQGALQFYMACVLDIKHTNYYYLAIVVAIMVILIGAYGIYRLIGSKQSIGKDAKPTILNRRQLNLWTVFILNIALVYFIATFFSQSHLNPDSIILALSIISGVIICHRTIATNSMEQPPKILALYCLMLGLLMFHFQEETIFQFNDHVALLLKTKPPEPILTFTMPIIMLLGIIGLWLRHYFGYVIVWIVCINTILCQPTHFLFYSIFEAIHTDNIFRYFPGMWSALWPMIPAIGIITSMLKRY